MEADLEAHAARLAFLTVDVAHLPIDPLREAIRRWSAMKPYLPRASELIELTREVAAPKHAGTNQAAESLQRYVVTGNQRLDAQGRYDIRWIVENEGLRLISHAEMEAAERYRRDPCRPGDVARILASVR